MLRLIQQRQTAALSYTACLRLQITEAKAAPKQILGWLIIAVGVAQSVTNLRIQSSHLTLALSVGKKVAPVSIIPKTWKVDLYESTAGAEHATLSWHSHSEESRVALAEAEQFCKQQEQKAQQAKAHELAWKSDLYQVHWRVNAPWPPPGVALVDTPGFSQLRADASVGSTFLYGSRGIVFQASDAFKYYFYRADAVLWCIRCDKLEDHDTLEMLESAKKRTDIVGVLTHMDKVPSERWGEVEDKAREKFGQYMLRSSRLGLLAKRY